MPDLDLIVIGAGPGGYVAAIRAAQLGMNVACVDRQYLGGTCLNVGCIPSKALLDSTERLHELRHGIGRHGIHVGEVSVDLPAMMKRKDEVVKALTGGVGFLFRKNKVESVIGSARIAGPGVVEVRLADGGARTLRARNILIATGSAPVELPALPFDGRHVLSSTEALALAEAPKRLAVVGAGYIGVEMGSVWKRLGSEVIVLEFLDRALPGMDREVAGLLQKMLEKQGFKFRFKTVVESARVETEKVQLGWASGEQRGVEEVDKVLVAVGRRPVTDGLGLAEIGVALTPKGYIEVNERFETNVTGIYAIGDVVGGVMLAHKAQEEGVAAVEIMAGHAASVNYRACPAVVFTHPELAQVGLTEEDAAKRGPIKVGRFPLTANGRARAMDATEGLVKVIADGKSDRILGVHILAARAGDMIAEAAVAMEFAASSEDLGRAFHMHPTLEEAVKEAALGVNREAIHI